MSGPADRSPLSRDFLLEVLGSLVATPSANPGDGELAMARRVADWLRPTGAELELVEVEPDRPSVAAVLRGDGSGPTLVLNGHMDTVPVEDRAEWASDPFEASVRHGNVYGRGACDMKAGLAIEIAVARHLAAHPERLRGTLVMHFAIGEETAEPGTLALVERGFVGDLGIVLEPTELRVATAQRGAAFLCVGIRGRSAHAGTPHRAVNPLTRLGAVLEGIRAYGTEIARRDHPLLGRPTATPTVVRGGESPNVIPGECELLVDRRLLPGESAAGEATRLADALAAVPRPEGPIEIAVSPLERWFASSEVDPDSELVGVVREAASRVAGGSPDAWGTPFSSDMRNLVNDAGMEAVTFGPGSIENCHCVDEHVPVAELEAAACAVAATAEGSGPK